MKLDLHCHVKEGSIDSSAGLEETILKLQVSGYDGMLITDHNTYNGYRYWKEQVSDQESRDFVVLKGIEYDTSDGGHFLCVLPENVDLPLMETRGLCLEKLIELVHNHGGILGPAHPYGPRFMSFIHSKKFRKSPEIIAKFDFIETYNASEDHLSNLAAANLAAICKKPGFGGSDSHRLPTVGTAFTKIPGTVTCESDLISLVREGEGAGITSDGNHYDTRLNRLMIYSYWPYNKCSALLRRRKRKKLTQMEMNG